MRLNTDKRQKTWNPNHRSESSSMLSSRFPVIIWVILVYIATLILQNFHHPNLISNILFTSIILLHIGLYWYAENLVKTRPWLYFLMQGLIVYFCTYLQPDGYPALSLGLYSALIGQGVGVYYQRSKLVFLVIYFIFLFCLPFIILGNTIELFFFLPLFTLMAVVVAAYAHLFFQQVEARYRMQAFLKELEIAHSQVEKLTLVNERQRMARDLHDTLAQGLTGLIMQLEAINTHLSKGNLNRAHEIVHQSMFRARSALADARRAIDDLRNISAGAVDFSDTVREEVQRFAGSTGITVISDIHSVRVPSGLIQEHSLFMISECLTNIARHAGAKQVGVSLGVEMGRLLIKIKDDGTGFDTELIGKQPGHYGLLGLHERARLIGGTIEIYSLPSEGTKIQIMIPLQGERV
ncbi:two-component system, NarL family, sensor histidine kinase YdfH [Paenibacillus sp. UNCCL117]|uniref:sensor histidine kinase n=1 Tax=unclassified Paenibacillus TaxID=185978 RepID=UPI0008856BC5|nr:MULTISPECIES: sensor histidine kinase [unclassified Paenibacillus]SDD72777.1 two-component system, NarL family, sensor histidine kinase YdfH [Paenibacillus sp. cl123]SFW45779.1 two-component system, NarL family, sensor histidine kinase YdfH [Paenibacillus sp. UNCCL117]